VIRAAALAVVLLAATPSLADTISVSGTARTYAAIVPERKPAPLVLVLHGNTQQGIDMQTRSSWPQLARREQFIAIFPDGLNRAWADLRGGADRVGRKAPAGTDDVAFLTALIAKYVRDDAADPKRIYVTACKPQQPIPILLMNGTADPLVAYAGGKGTSRFGLPDVWATERTIAFWRRINGCEEAKGAVTDLPDTDRSDTSTVTRIESRCPPLKDVVEYRINGGGHRMPGRNPDAKAKRIVDAMLGPQNRDIDGPEIIWAFFKRFAR
jgi:polyhydroxybutyrate depolymerase